MSCCPELYICIYTCCGVDTLLVFMLLESQVIAATNRPDVLDPALLRSGRLDRKIELPNPTEEARTRILQIHSRKMNVDKDDVNFDEVARSCDDFNGAQLKAICVEAGMLALRRGSSEIKHEDFMEGLAIVAAKKKGSLDYFGG